jgi:hypothetical protein
MSSSAARASAGVGEGTAVTLFELKEDWALGTGAHGLETISRTVAIQSPGQGSLSRCAHSRGL